MKTATRKTRAIHFVDTLVFLDAGKDTPYFVPAGHSETRLLARVLAFASYVANLPRSSSQSAVQQCRAQQTDPFSSHGAGSRHQHPPANGTNARCGQSS